MHVHGYDIQATLSPKSPSVMRFVAESRVDSRSRLTHLAPWLTGHGAKRHHEVTLLYLEVMPE